MRNKILVAVALLLCVCTLSFGISFNDNKVLAETKDNSVITVADSNSVKDSVLNARFLNMLNHSFVYGSDMYDMQALVNGSVLALLDLAEDGFIAQNYVSDYIFNMYGINADFSDVNTDFEQKQGFVYVIPRGYCIYTHKVKTVTDNKDGSYTVVTNIEISLEDGSVVNDTATTIFLKNSDSQFGFNIVYSEIGEVIEDTLDC